MQALRRFWSRGPGQKVTVIAVASAIVLCSCIALLVGIAALLTPQSMVITGGPSGADTTQYMATATALAMQQQITLTSATATVAAMQAKATAAAPAPAGSPALGAPLSSFTKAYGSYVTVTGQQYEFFADKAQTIQVGVLFTKGAASWIAVLGPTSWSNSQTMAACEAYLPAGATEFNQIAPYTDYHSSRGEAIIQNSGNGTCVVFLAQS